MSVSYGGDSITFADGSIVASGSQGFKNKIINGAITIDQRNAGANIVLGSAYTVDRWKFDRVNGGGSQVYYGQQVVDAPAGSGFTNSYQVKVTTGGTPSGSDYAQLTQYIEGYNFSDLNWGTANAKSLTISFWAKSSLSATLSVTLRSGGFDRSYVAPFTINTPNTWEYKTITVPGCTDGTFYANNSYGLDVHFCLGATSYYGTSTTNTWLTNGANGSYIGLTGNGIIATTGATFNFTGFQAEKGSTASTFEFRSYQKELMLCQRYCYAQYGGSGDRLGFGYCGTATLFILVVPLPVTMRSTPTLTSCSAGAVNDNQAAYNSSAITIGDSITNTCVNLKVTSSGMTIGRGAQFYFSATGSSMILSAEL
jgi:hypothetical protein